MTKDEALKLALEALDGLSEPYDVLKAQEAIREALAQPEQEPVGKFAKFSDGLWKEVTEGSAGVLLYTSPPHRKPLTKTRVGNYLRRHVNGDVGMYRNGFKDGVRFAEAAHGIKEKNT